MSPDTREDMEAMREQFLEALLEKDRLGYMGSLVRGLIHNINGPLQNISMLVEMLVKGLDLGDRMVKAQPQDFLQQWDGWSQKQRQRFGQMLQQVAHLAEMLRDFMVIQEIERNESEVDLKLLLGKLAAIFRADLFMKHQVELEVRVADGLPLVRILGRDLVLALVHLFKNALTAVREAERKKIVIEGYREGDWIYIVFRDLGCGFDEKEDPKVLFDLFSSNWPSSDPTRQDNGERHFGVGLYAVRYLLGPYGVRVSLERQEGETRAMLQVPI